MFDFYYKQQSEQFTFYRIPKVLFGDDKFKNISTDSKVLYGLMLDRMGFSMKNNWYDENERVYIYFTTENAMEFLNCRTEKATKLFKELEQVGLIIKKRQGFGKPARIYVMNFVSMNENRNSHSFGNRNYSISEIENNDFRKSKCIDTNNIKTNNIENNIYNVQNEDFAPSPNPNNEKKQSQKKEANELFERVWKLYPNKIGKGAVSDTAKIRLLKVGEEHLTRAIERYLNDWEKEKEWRKILNGSTFFNSRYVDYLDENYEGVNENGNRDGSRQATTKNRELEEDPFFKEFGEKLDAGEIDLSDLRELGMDI